MAQDRTRRKLIDAALQCIGEVGVEATTNRMIASKAKVNGALVNYHFGTKEKLIEEAIRESLDRYFQECLRGEVHEGLGNASEGRGDGLLRRLLTTSLRDAVASPLVTRSYMKDALVRGACEGPFIEGLRSFLQREAAALTDGLGDEEPKKARIAVAQMLACVIFFGLMPDFFESFIDLDLDDPAAQESFVESLVSRFRA